MISEIQSNFFSDERAYPWKLLRVLAGFDCAVAALDRSCSLGIKEDPYFFEAFGQSLISVESIDTPQIIQMFRQAGVAVGAGHRENLSNTFKIIQIEPGRSGHRPTASSRFLAGLIRAESIWQQMQTWSS
jgi:hypothetical protein